MSEAGTDMHGRARFVHELDAAAVGSFADLADIEVTGSDSSARYYATSCDGEIVTMSFDGTAKARITITEPPADIWTEAEREQSGWVITGCLASGLFRACWPVWRERVCGLDSAVSELPLPPCETGLTEQLALLSRRHLEVVSTNDATALRGALDRVVAELFRLDLDSLMTYEWDG